ncbi:MAG: hypothetical protein ACK4I8_06315, partial [Armatimonadota bacterium]
TTENFRLTGGLGSCRAVISAGRQIGRSGCRQKNSAHKDVRPPERKISSAHQKFASDQSPLFNPAVSYEKEGQGLIIPLAP